MGNGREISPYCDLIDEVTGTRNVTCPLHVLEVSDILAERDNHGSKDPAPSSQIEADANKSETASSITFREEDISENKNKD